MKQVNSKITEYIKGGFFKGVGIGAGLLTTSIFAAAAAMNVFSPGQTISSAQINQNFAIAAPEGAVMAFYLDSCPEGWAPADGTNGTPDLRGVFIRGRDDLGTAAGAASRDPGGNRAVADALQGDAFQGHYGSLTVYVTNNTGGMLQFQSYDPSPANGGANGGYAGTVNVGLTSDGTNGNPRVAAETRPVNKALTYCMRKN